MSVPICLCKLSLPQVCYVLELAIWGSSVRHQRYSTLCSTACTRCELGSHVSLPCGPPVWGSTVVSMGLECGFPMWDPLWAPPAVNMQCGVPARGFPMSMWAQCVQEGAPIWGSSAGLHCRLQCGGPLSAPMCGPNVKHQCEATLWNSIRCGAPPWTR